MLFPFCFSKLEVHQLFFFLFLKKKKSVSFPWAYGEATKKGKLPHGGAGGVDPQKSVHIGKRTKNGRMGQPPPILPKEGS